MSTGGVFTLVANDGKADRLIMATALLNQRIKDVMCARAAAGRTDPTPTLVDLEQTHIVFVNAHFKPYAAVGFEYNKVRATAGTPALGGRLTFSIPQFGDFFNDMVLRVRLGAATGAAGPLPVAGGPYIPALTVPGTNASSGGGGNVTASTCATQYAVAALNAIYNTPSRIIAGPITYYYNGFGNTGGANGGQVQGSDTSANYLIYWTAYYNGTTIGAPNNLSQYGPIATSTQTLIYNQTLAYWTANNYTAIFDAAQSASNAAILSAYSLVNAMFAIALSRSNSNFRKNMSQSTYNQITLGCVFGIYQGMVQSAILSSPTTTNTVGNQYWAFLTYVFAQTYGTPWTVPNYIQYELVDAFGNYIETNQAGVATYANFVRYCEFPGNRLISSVRFDVNSNPLDQYTRHVSTMLEKFTVPTHKRVGYNRLTGQAVPLVGCGALQQSAVNDPNAATTPAGIARWSLTQSNSTVAVFSPNAANNPANLVSGSLVDASIPTGATLNQYSAQFDINQQVLAYNNGPQTPKPVQPPLELWHKLKFWFCDDVRQSIPSVAIPFGQRFITVDLAPATDLLSEFPSLYLQEATTAPLLTLSGATTVVGSQRTVTHAPIQQLFGVAAPPVLAAELYVNNIFVNPEVHDIYIKRVGFSLIRVYREQLTPVNSSGSSRELMSQLKFPVEYMYVGVQPAWNTAVANSDQWRDWHRFTYQVNAAAGTAAESQAPAIPATYAFADYPPSTAADVGASTSVTITTSVKIIAITNVAGVANIINAGTGGLVIPALGGTQNIQTTNTTLTGVQNQIVGILSGPNWLAGSSANLFGYAASNQPICIINLNNYATNVLPLVAKNGTIFQPSQCDFTLNQAVTPVQVIDNNNYFGYGINAIIAYANNHNNGEPCYPSLTNIVYIAAQPETILGTITNNASSSITTVGFGTLNSHLIQNTPPTGVTPPANLTGSRFGQVVPNRYWLNVPTVDSMSLIAHGITIYDDFQDLFYSGYAPYHYGCANVTTPDDPGAFFVNMALFPRSYQPSGHLNISRARETYLAWTSSYVGAQSAAQLIVVAIAINFLLISDGSAVLRYST